ncbi:MAG: Ig-like domain-containing protein [Oscillospiraceae bacterium]|nr:Ig-like domain-containing protein [Oscillospiraceae bacterium]
MKRAISIFLAMATILSMATISVGANSLASNSIRMEALEFYTINNLKPHENRNYRLSIPRDGTITIRNAVLSVEGDSREHGHRWSLGDGPLPDLRLLNANGEQIGSDTGISSNGVYQFKDLKVGVHYITIINQCQTMSLSDLYYTFTPDEKPVIEFRLTLKTGARFQLGAALEHYNGRVSWLSTNRNVAAVSDKGLVTANRKGNTTIRATLDNGTYAQIRITVTE